MKAKINTRKNKHTIKYNSNFLNNQNYIISDFKKKVFINNFIILKYLSIVTNRVIGTIILTVIIFVLYVNDLFFLKEVFNVMLFLGAATISFGILLFIPIFFINAKNKKINRKINEKLNIFDIDSPILSLKNIFLENKNGKTNILKKIISFLVIVGLGISFGLITFIFIDGIINFILKGEFYSKTSDSYIGFMLFPLILVFIIYFYKKIYTFISRIRLLTVLLSPLFFVIYFLNLLYKLIIKDLNYNLYVKKIGFTNKINFSKLEFNGAENKYYKIIKK